MRKICVFTGTRAEYGLLRPLLREISDDRELQLCLLVSGTHLSPEFGRTCWEIEQDGFVMDEQVEILISSDSPVGICKSIGLGLIGFSEALSRLSPDILVVLGDRFEAFAVAAAAMVLRLPIAHIHGGEVTQGVIDEPIRHSISKMSHLHFTSTEVYRRRVIQLGESPEKVFNVGALGVEIILNTSLFSKEELERDLKIDVGRKFILVTYHPVTLEFGTSREQFQNLLGAIECFPGLNVVFTKANADMHGRVINEMIDEYVGKNQNRAVCFVSLGQKRYLSLMSRASAVVGNSSSGILEAPVFHVPTVDIGDRQKGRLKPMSVIHVPPEKQAIANALEIALSRNFLVKAQAKANPYENKSTALEIKDILKHTELQGVLKKAFHDLV